MQLLKTTTSFGNEEICNHWTDYLQQVYNNKKKCWKSSINSSHCMIIIKLIKMKEVIQITAATESTISVVSGWIWRYEY